LPGQFEGDPPGTVAASMIPENVGDEGHQFTILLAADGVGHGLPGIVARAADIERVAQSHQGKRSFESELFDEGVKVDYVCRLRLSA